MDVKIHRSGIKKSVWVGMRKGAFSRAASSEASMEQEFWKEKRQPERCLQ